MSPTHLPGDPLRTAIALLKLDYTDNEASQSIVSGMDDDEQVAAVVVWLVAIVDEFASHLSPELVREVIDARMAHSFELDGQP